ncbi:MAG: threonine/serine exporter family protein [Lachnospiraceae bacterium]
MKVEDVLNVALDIGEHMLECGAAVNRVEDTIARICRSYGVQNVEVFSINSLSLVSAVDEEGHAVTRTKRTYSLSTNLHQLELLNALSRYVCDKKPSMEEIEAKKQELLSEDKNIGWLYCLGYFIATGSFAIYFGGSLSDGLAAALISLFVFAANRYVKKKDTNQLVYTVVMTTLAGALAILLVRFGIGEHVDKVMIGDIMLFIPGLVMVNSIRDMLYGDIMTGLFRLIEAVLVALAIACGMAISLLVLGGLLP